MTNALLDRGESVTLEGPSRYTPADVAHAFGQALGREVHAVQTPQSTWLATFQSLGFSPVAASSYTRMTALTLEGPERPDAPVRGSTSLAEYIDRLVRRPD